MCNLKPNHRHSRNKQNSPGGLLPSRGAVGEDGGRPQTRTSKPPAARSEKNCGTWSLSQKWAPAPAPHSRTSSLAPSSENEGVGAQRPAERGPGWVEKELETVRNAHL